MRVARGPLAWISAGALMLLAVTFVIGRPTVFTDTDDYYAQGRGVVRALNIWITTGKPPFEFEDAQYRLTHADGGDEEPVHNQDGARSVYYGLLLYVSEQLGRLWLMAAIQCGVAAALIYGLWRTVTPGARSWTYGAIMAGLSLGSTLPVFTGFAMPDVFAGFAVIATLLLMIYGDRLERVPKLALWLLLAASLNFHASNLATCILLAACTVAVLMWTRASARVVAGRVGLVVGACVVAIAAASAFAEVVRLRTGDELGRPPFLVARVLADGPGRTYLRRACDHGATYALCAYRRLPLDDSEDILWSDEPTRGIFNIASFRVRQRLEHEQGRFVLAAVASDPMRQLSASLRNWGVQLVDLGLDEPLRDPGYYLLDPYWKTTTLPELIQGARPCAPARGGCRVFVPALPAAWTYGVVAVTALAWLAWRIGHEGLALMVRARAGQSSLALLYFLTLLLVGAVILNAGVCGALSGCFARYQARILWLVPLAAMLLECGRSSVGSRRGLTETLRSPRAPARTGEDCRLRSGQERPWIGTRWTRPNTAMKRRPSPPYSQTSR